jgi:hypothetical protein
MAGWRLLRLAQQCESGLLVGHDYEALGAAVYAALKAEPEAHSCLTFSRPHSEACVCLEFAVAIPGQNASSGHCSTKWASDIAFIGGTFRGSRTSSSLVREK